MAGKRVKGYAERVRSMNAGEILFADRELAGKLCREASRLARRDGWDGQVVRWRNKTGPQLFSFYCVMRVF